MGWSMPDGSEIFGYEDVEREFTFERVTTSGPVFDLVKLTSINGKYIRALSDDELFERLLPYLPEEMDKERARQVAPVLKDRLTRLGEFAELTGFFFGPVPEYSADLLIPKKGTLSDAAKALEQVKGLLEGLKQPWTHEEWESGMRDIADNLGLKAGDLFMILRVAVTGSKVSPPLYESMEILGRDEVLSRVDHALEVARTAS